MKKTLFYILAAFAAAVTAFAGEFDITREIPGGYTGTYIPCDFADELLATKSYDLAMKKSHPSNYDILYLDDNICHSDNWFHDGYAIPAAKIDLWSFGEKDGTRVLIDENSKMYLQISEYTGAKGTRDFEAYVFNAVFGSVKNNSKLIVRENILELNSLEFRLFKDTRFYDCGGCNLWLRDTSSLYVLKLKGHTALVYAVTGSGEMPQTFTLDRVIMKVKF